MVFNATFNKISVISWRSALLVEYPDKTNDVPQVTNKPYHIIMYRVHRDCTGFELEVLGTTKYAYKHKCHK